MTNSNLVTQKQVSGIDDKNRNILAVLAKKTFQIDNVGNCTLHEQELPLVVDLVDYEHNVNLLKSDTDLFPFKKYADVVVKGSAINYPKTEKFIAEINIGSLRHQMLIQGNQKVFINQSNKITFGDIEPVESIPLRYDFAYGGKDLEAEKKIDLPPAEIIKHLPPGLDLLTGSIYRYPRNPEGKGYLVELSKNGIENLEIPNIQDPLVLLTPENIVLHDYSKWFNMPIPLGTDWVNPVWFPRHVYAGMVEYEHNKINGLKEIENGLVEPDVFFKKPLGQGFNMRFCNGASLGLQLPFTNVGNVCQLINIHPKKPNFTIKIPTNRPKIWVDGRKGKLMETNPVIHTILIEPDENRLSIVWRGSAPALRPYFEEELKTMPFKVEY